MSNSETAAPEPGFDGHLFLYDKPALLTKAAHDGMGLTALDRPYDFVRDIKALPLVTTEVQTAQKHFPVVFSEFEKPMLVAIVGIVDDKNLFVDDNGQWDRHSYVPSYARAHPFALARHGDEEFAVIIDESAECISKTPEQPFFDGDALSAVTQQRVDFCGHVSHQREQTRIFCERIRDLGLLNGQRVVQKLPDGSEEKIADYVTIDAKKLTELDKDTLQELHRDGSLAAIFAQLFSLENWNRLIMRRNEQLARS